MSDFFNISGFAPHQYAWLATGGVFLFFSVWFHLHEKKGLALLFLTLTAFSIYTFAALLDPFLNLWDERFHAVVAKNCISDPLEPKFYNHPLVLETDYLNWTCAHVWLHKQPLFLWQMALSMKLFGANEFALRLPSVLMATLSVPIGYQIGKRIINSKIGYYTALAITFSWFLIDLVSGASGIDHNDVAFFFYVTASLWSFVEYIYSDRKRGWVILIGLFSGCAIMTKWLAGLLVYFTWGVYLLSTYGWRLRKWNLSHYLSALVITTLIFLPWQIFIFSAYPDAALHEFEYSNKHLYEQIEFQRTDFFFHISRIPFLYLGHKMSYTDGFTGLRIVTLLFNALILVAGLVRMGFLIKKRNINITLYSTLIFVYLFFSIATTKMPAYPFIVGIIWFMSLGVVIDWIIERIGVWIKKPKLRIGIQIIVLFLCSWYMFNFTRIRQMHTSLTCWRIDQIENKARLLQIKDQLPENAILFNVRGDERQYYNMTFSEACFYLDRDCYPYAPSPESLQRVKEAGFIPVYFIHHPLPDHCQDDPDALYFDIELLNDL